MATISSPWVGISKGKLGEGVYYHANGKQLARARNRQPANPRTDKQAVQRMVLASAAKAIAALRPLYDHSAEGVQVGQQSIFYWQRKLTQGFRAAAADGIDTAGSIVADFAIKGAPMIAVYDGMPLTEGRLTMRPITNVSDGSLNLSLSAALAQTITSQAEYEAELAKLGIEPGDQLTFVYIAENLSQPVASFGNETDFAGIARYARVTFVSELPENFSGSLLVNNGGPLAFNSALIAKSEGTFPALLAEDDNLEFTPTIPEGFVMLAATIVRSQLQTNGKTWYNSAKFIKDENHFDENDASGTYPSYMDNAEGIDVGSPLYLKNAIVSPN